MVLRKNELFCTIALWVKDKEHQESQKLMIDFGQGCGNWNTITEGLAHIRKKPLIMFRILNSRKRLSKSICVNYTTK